MSENQQRSSEHESEEILGNHRYDSLERLIAWSVQKDEYFIFYRVKSFREVTLRSGEKLDVPAAIACAWTDRDVEPSFDGVEGDPSDGEPGGWTFQEYETDPELQYNRARCFDPTQGRWVSENPLGFDPAEENLYPHARQGMTPIENPENRT